jgi:DNA primase
VSDAIDFKELVRARTDIVSVVGESIALAPRRGGSEFVGLCPFHDDHSPSLHVYPDRQSFRCWVCDTGGDVFSFVMKHEGVTFAEAIDLLGERAGLERPKRQRQAGESGIDKPRLYDVLAWADRQFRTFLKSSADAKDARDYIASRGISPAMAERFGLGYVPRDWAWLLNRARGTYTGRDLVAAGVAKERTEGRTGFYDFYVDRVTFPIRDERSRVVSFGGRIMPGRGDESGPKYLNGLETPVFPKSKLVYALDLAREAVRKSGTVVVM